MLYLFGWTCKGGKFAERLGLNVFIRILMCWAVYKLRRVKATVLRAYIYIYLLFCGRIFLIRFARTPYKYIECNVVDPKRRKLYIYIRNMLI